MYTQVVAVTIPDELVFFIAHLEQEKCGYLFLQAGNWPKSQIRNNTKVKARSNGKIPHKHSINTVLTRSEGTQNKRTVCLQGTYVVLSHLVAGQHASPPYTVSAGHWQRAQTLAQLFWRAQMYQTAWKRTHLFLHLYFSVQLHNIKPQQLLHAPQ